MKYPVYPKYKDSGVEWLGEVPEGWDAIPARRVFEQRRDGRRPEDVQLSASQRYGVVPQNIFIELEEQKVMLALAGLDNFKHVEPNDFVISLRSFQGGIEWSKYAGCVSPAYTVLRATSPIAAEYWAYLLKSEPYICALQTTTDGIRDGKNISYTQFGALALPLPILKEQQTIAAFLDHETAKIDALITEQEKLVSLLQEKRQAVISQTVTKGLNPDAPMKDSGVEWLGEVPEEWEIKPLRYFADILRGKFTHRPRNDPDFYDGIYPFIQTGDITAVSKYITEYSQTLNERGIAVSKEFPKGTLVMAIAANIGDVAILDFPAYFPDSIVGFFPKSETNLFFLYYLIISLKEAFIFSSTVSTQLNLNIDQISSVVAAYPPTTTQQIIVKYLDAETAKIDALIAEANKAIALLKERRSAIISAAVTGKIDVRNIPLQEAV